MDDANPKTAAEALRWAAEYATNAATESTQYAMTWGNSKGHAMATAEHALAHAFTAEATRLEALPPPELSVEDKARIVRAIEVKSDRKLFMWHALEWRDIEAALSNAGGFAITRVRS